MGVQDLTQTQDLVPGFAPHWHAGCRILVLGSFPGQISLAQGDYYAHPRNQFWPIMAQIIDRPLPEMPFEQRYECLSKADIALWDVIERCVRPGSLDADIRDATPAPLLELASKMPHLKAVICNGRKAEQGVRSLCWPANVSVFALPSTSPAYAAMTVDEKTRQWRTVFEPLL